MTVLYLVRPFLLWPLSIFSVFIGYIFGFPVGVPLILLGTLFTCLLPYLVAIRLGDQFSCLGQIAERGTVLVETTGEFRGMVATRLSPAPADAVSYSAGLTGVSIRSFAVGTILGELPWAIFYALVGQSIQTFSVESAQHTDVRLILITTVISILLIARPLYKYVCGDTDKDDEIPTDYSG